MFMRINFPYLIILYILSVILYTLIAIFIILFILNDSDSIYYFFFFDWVNKASISEVVLISCCVCDSVACILYIFCCCQGMLLRKVWIGGRLLSKRWMGDFPLAF